MRSRMLGNKAAVETAVLVSGRGNSNRRRRGVKRTTTRRGRRSVKRSMSNRRKTMMLPIKPAIRSNRNPVS